MTHYPPITIPTAEVGIPQNDGTSQKLTLVGASTHTVSDVMRKHGAGAALLYNKYVQGQLDLFEESSARAIAELISDLPEMFSTILVSCCLNDLPPEVANRLPIPVQVEALTAIFKLTFVGEDSLGKFIDAATKIMEQATPVTAE